MAPNGASDPRHSEVMFGEPQTFRETCIPGTWAHERPYVSHTENELLVSPGPELRAVTPPPTRWRMPCSSAPRLPSPASYLVILPSGCMWQLPQFSTLSTMLVRATVVSGVNATIGAATPRPFSPTQSPHCGQRDLTKNPVISYHT